MINGWKEAGDNPRYVSKEPRNKLRGSIETFNNIEEGEDR